MLFRMKPSLQIHFTTPLWLVQSVDKESQAGGSLAHRSVAEENTGRGNQKQRLKVDHWAFEHIEKVLSR